MYWQGLSQGFKWSNSLSLRLLGIGARPGRRDLQELEAGNWAWALRLLQGAQKGEQLRGMEWKCRRKSGKCEQIKHWAWALRLLQGAQKGEQLRGMEWKCRRKREV